VIFLVCIINLNRLWTFDELVRSELCLITDPFSRLLTFTDICVYDYVRGGYNDLVYRLRVVKDFYLKSWYLLLESWIFRWDSFHIVLSRLRWNEMSVFFISRLKVLWKTLYIRIATLGGSFHVMYLRYVNAFALFYTPFTKRRWGSCTVERIRLIA
jgi:hypothetical protein